MTVQAFTVLSFTGNNIGPKGDLASRSLVARLDIERADPENRPFRAFRPCRIHHRQSGQDPAGALHHPDGQPAAPRAEGCSRRGLRLGGIWSGRRWSMRRAASCGLARPTSYPCDEAPTAIHIDFGTIFRDVEGEDEEAASLGDVLDVLHDVWPTSYFTAADVLKMIEEPEGGGGPKAERAKAFFKQQGGVADLSAMKIGRRLGFMLDTPIEFEGKTLKLVRLKQGETSAPGKRFAQSFIVKVVG